jgi:hypothetical protein
MPTDDANKLRSFSSADRFVAEVKAAAGSRGPLRAGYVFAGDEVFLYERCRRAVVDSLIDPTLREFSLSDLDLAETSIFHVLDLARTPSLMAPFQVIFVRNLKTSIPGVRRKRSSRRSRTTSAHPIPRRCSSLSPTTCASPLT